MEVTWSPGFNGGARQQFSLEYLKDGTNGWRALALDPTIDDMTISLSVNVSDLNPATAYTFRIRSRNTYGYSDYSNTARVVTDGELWAWSLIICGCGHRWRVVGVVTTCGRGH